MPLMRGLIPSPEKLAAAIPFRRPAGLLSAPTSGGFLSPTSILQMWGNDQWGDCVSAEEAEAKQNWSGKCGLPPLSIPDTSLINWARQYRYANGATLTDVMDTMIKSGIMGPDSKLYHDGAYNSVDWTQSSLMQAAILQSPVKIAVAASQFESALNNTGGGSGWYMLNSGRDRNYDHCVGIRFYGSANDCYDAMKISLPSKVPASTYGYVIFTWKTYGFISENSLINVTGEGYVRVPCTPEQVLPVPGPAPTPGPTPNPNPTPVPVLDGVIIVDPTTRTVLLPTGWSSAPRPS